MLESPALLSSLEATPSYSACIKTHVRYMQTGKQVRNMSPVYSDVCGWVSTTFRRQLVDWSWSRLLWLFMPQAAEGTRIHIHPSSPSAAAVCSCLSPEKISYQNISQIIPEIVKKNGLLNTRLICGHSQELSRQTNLTTVSAASSVKGVAPGEVRAPRLSLKTESFLAMPVRQVHVCLYVHPVVYGVEL